MKRSKTWYHKLAGALCIVGIIIIACAWIVADFDYRKFSNAGTYEQKQYQAQLQNVTSIVVDTSNETVKVVPSKDDELHVTYYENKIHSYTFEEAGDELRIEEQETRKFYQYFMTFDIDVEGEQALVIELPASYDQDITIRNKNEDVLLSDFEKLAKVSVNTSYGEVTIRNIGSLASLEIGDKQNDISLKKFHVDGAIDLSTTYGEIDLQDVVCGSSLTMKSSNDNFYLDHVSVAEMLQAETTYGDIEIEHSLAGSTKLRSTNGKIHLKDAFTTASIEADTSYGAILFKDLKADTISLKTSNDEVKGNVIGKQSDYTIDSDVHNGNTLLLPSEGTTDKSIYVKTSYGDCTVTFNGQ